HLPLRLAPSCVVNNRVVMADPPGKEAVIEVVRIARKHHHSLEPEEDVEHLPMIRLAHLMGVDLGGGPGFGEVRWIKGEEGGGRVLGAKDFQGRLVENLRVLETLVDGWQSFDGGPPAVDAVVPSASEPCANRRGKTFHPAGKGLPAAREQSGGPYDGTAL